VYRGETDILYILDYTFADLLLHVLVSQTGWIGTYLHYYSMMQENFYHKFEQ